MNDVERKHLKQITEMHHDLIVVMQSVLIEWKHGKGADAALQWIVNTLDGPGLLPSIDEPYGKEAQAYFDANQANPMPTCFCGRPSNQGWMGQGFCCTEHFSKAKAASLN